MNKVEPVTTPAISEPPLASVEVPNDVAREKAVVHHQEPKPEDSKAITLVESEWALSLSISFLGLFTFLFWLLDFFRSTIRT